MYTGDKDSEWKLNVCNSDVKLPVWIRWESSFQTTPVPSLVRLVQLCDDHKHNWRRKQRTSLFVQDAVSSTLSSVASGLNENVFFFTSVPAEELRPPKQTKGTFDCDAASLSTDECFCIDEAGVITTQRGWKDRQWRLMMTLLLTLCIIDLL